MEQEIDSSHIAPPSAGVAAPRRAPEDVAALLLEFETRYQDLVDLLCWSAKEGANMCRDLRYAELQAWFTHHYDRVRALLHPHLDDGADEPGATAGDAFEGLFGAPTVTEVVNSPTVISRIQRTRAALDYARLEMERRRLS